MNGNMRFNYHPKFEGLHAVLSASKSSWINYEDDQFEEFFRGRLDAQRGTELHAYAAEAIRLRRKQPKTRDTVNMFVNDVIGYRMASEQLLLYSENVFGTADAISFKAGLLRIFDLKTGVTKASFNQLLIYAALFCLEYDVKPAEIAYDIRMYQSNEIIPIPLDQDEIIFNVSDIAGKIIRFDRRIKQLRLEEMA